LAEIRALKWLADRGEQPEDVAHLCCGWDIQCGNRKYEVKGRRSLRTDIRLTHNEYAQAKKHKGRYVLLIFTADREEALMKVTPEIVPDPAPTREWEERKVTEYLLME